MVYLVDISGHQVKLELNLYMYIGGSSYTEFIVLKMLQQNYCSFIFYILHLERSSYNRFALNFTMHLNVKYINIVKP